MQPGKGVDAGLHRHDWEARPRSRNFASRPQVPPQLCPDRRCECGLGTHSAPKLCSECVPASPCPGSRGRPGRLPQSLVNGGSGGLHASCSDLIGASASTESTILTGYISVLAHRRWSGCEPKLWVRVNVSPSLPDLIRQPAPAVEAWVAGSSPAMTVRRVYRSMARVVDITPHNVESHPAGRMKPEHDRNSACHTSVNRYADCYYVDARQSFVEPIASDAHSGQDFAYGATLHPRLT